MTYVQTMPPSYSAGLLLVHWDKQNMSKYKHGMPGPVPLSEPAGQLRSATFASQGSD